MTTSLNTTELDTVTIVRLQARAERIGYWQVYSRLTDTLESKDVTSSGQTVFWLCRATENNAFQDSALEVISSSKGDGLPAGGVTKKLLDVDLVNNVTNGSAANDPAFAQVEAA